MLHQYTPKERLGPSASTSYGQFWSVEDLALIVREQYGVEYLSRTSYSTSIASMWFQLPEERESLQVP